MKQEKMRAARWLRHAVIGAGLALMPAVARAADDPPGDTPSPPALMASMQMTCFGSSHFAYAPAMGRTPQDVTVTFTSLYSGCLAMMGQGISSVSVQTATTHFPGVTCSEVLSSAPDSLTLVWNNGTTSVVSLAPAEVNIEETTTTVTFTGKVLEGNFKGMSVARSSTYVNTDLGSRCLSSTGLADANVFSLLVLTQPR